MTTAASTGGAVQALQTAPRLLVEEGRAAMRKASSTGYRPPGSCALAQDHALNRRTASGVHRRGREIQRGPVERRVKSYGFIRSTHYPRSNIRAGLRIFHRGIWRLSRCHRVGNLPVQSNGLKQRYRHG